MRQVAQQILTAPFCGEIRRLYLQAKVFDLLLREGNHTVAEVANRVGYAHLGHFATGFKRQFGIMPSQCLAEKCAGR